MWYNNFPFPFTDDGERSQKVNRCFCDLRFWSNCNSLQKKKYKFTKKINSQICQFNARRIERDIKIVSRPFVVPLKKEVPQAVFRFYENKNGDKKNQSIRKNFKSQICQIQSIRKKTAIKIIASIYLIRIKNETESIFFAFSKNRPTSRRNKKNFFSINTQFFSFIRTEQTLLRRQKPK